MFSAQKNASPSGRLYVEDVFSTWLYAGNSGAQSINNGIDTLGKGGLVWLKNRTSSLSHILIDTAQGCTFSGGKNLISNTTGAAGTIAANTFKFDSTGFSFGSAAAGGAINGSGNNYASWTFRKAPKFFDVVTYTGTGSARTIAHSLGIAPGCILVKRTDTASDWQVYHRGIANTEYVVLNSDAAKATGTTRWNSTTPTSTEFTVGTDATVNASGGTYVAYLFAHDTTSDGLIQCGSLTFPTGTSTVDVNLGWEPQWFLIKSADTIDPWYIFDNMRGMGASNTFKSLQANSSNAEADFGNATYPVNVTSTGLSLNGGFFGVGTNTKFVYIAIRRGPMKTPTLGTSVYTAVARAGTGVNDTITSGIVSDLVLSKVRSFSLGSGGYAFGWFDRLRGAPKVLQSNQTGAEVSSFTDSLTGFDRSDGIRIGAEANSIFINRADNIDYNGNFITYFLRRAPGFFDEVCYTGNTGTQNLNHNLGVVPEMMIVKARNAGEDWFVYSASLLATEYLTLTSTNGKTGGSSTTWNSTRPTASVFSVGNTYNTNGPYNYVAYLFASCPGVSKVGSYTGNGSSQTINCGFAAGARFVLIKRTDSTGDWYVWDTARGIVAGNDPYLLLNSTNTEVTSNDTIDTDSTGFVVNQVSATNVNVSSATYIYLAIA